MIDYKWKNHYMLISTNRFPFLSSFVDFLFPYLPLEPILHFSRALLAREYGFEIETHKDTNFSGNLEVDE